MNEQEPAGQNQARTGGCQCGNIRYSVTAEPRGVYVCHCTECRAQSASAFGISVLVGRNDVQHAGTPKCWTRTTAKGSTMDCYFCEICGTRLWHIAADDPGTVSIKGGSLDQPPDLSNAPQIWTASRVKGCPLPLAAPYWPGEPAED